MMTRGVYLLLAFLFVFSMVNLVNTLMTNLLARQQELGILQSVGMTGKPVSYTHLFLCSLCTFVQSYWNQSVQQEIEAYGDWDAQLLEIHAGQLDLIRNNENIQTIMVKGDNQTASLPAASGLPYLLIQNCDGEMCIRDRYFLRY